MIPQEGPFSNLNRMLDDFRQATAQKINYAPKDCANIPLTPLPLADDPSNRLQFALMFDGFHRYIEAETKLLMNPELAADVLAWQKSTMPLSYEELSKLYARVNPDERGVNSVLRRFKKFKIEYDLLTKVFEDETVPTPMKLIVRYNILMACCILVTAMSVVLYRMREGLPVEN
jgi:hypothetical protein